MTNADSEKGQEKQYFLQQASNLKRLEEIDDGGMKQLWEIYGHQECLRAEMVAKQNDAPLPPTNTNEQGTEELNHILSFTSGCLYCSVSKTRPLAG